MATQLENVHCIIPLAIVRHCNHTHIDSYLPLFPIHAHHHIHTVVPSVGDVHGHDGKLRVAAPAFHHIAQSNVTVCATFPLSGRSPSIPGE